MNATTEELRLRVTGGLRLINTNGTVRVHGVNDLTITLSATKSCRSGDARNIVVAATNLATDVEVRVQVAADVSNETVAIDTEVPERASLHVELGTGDVDVHDVQGNVSVQLGTGDINVTHESGTPTLDLRCETGDVLVHISRSFAGNVDIATSTGDVTHPFQLPTTGTVGRSVRGVVGTGSGALSIELGTGDAEVRFK